MGRCPAAAARARCRYEASSTGRVRTRGHHFDATIARRERYITTPANPQRAKRSARRLAGSPPGRKCSGRFREVHGRKGIFGSSQRFASRSRCHARARNPVKTSKSSDSRTTFTPVPRYAPNKAPSLACLRDAYRPEDERNSSRVMLIALHGGCRIHRTWIFLSPSEYASLARETLTLKHAARSVPLPVCRPHPASSSTAHSPPP